MDKNSNAYSLTFAAVLCGILAVFLAGAYEGVKSTVAANILFDKQTNVMIALGLYDKKVASTRVELEAMYKKFVRAEVLEVERGEIDKRVKRSGVEQTIQVRVVKAMRKTEFQLEELAALNRTESKKPKGEQKEYAEFYRRVDDSGASVSYAIPISGYGLWGTLYGYLGIDKDKVSIQGITFYKHKETPGLGAEVDNPAWQASWQGKTFMDGGSFTSIVVKKGAVIASEPGADHMVDGLSGATITSNGVTKFVRADLLKYKPYLDQL